MTGEEGKIRLQLYLARSGVASRRKCAELIEKGKVSVNGETVSEPYFRIDPDKDTVEFAGKKVEEKKHRFYKLYKPPGYLSTMSDDRGRKTIADLIPSEYTRLFPVGRLDLDSEGLMIITNHGEAANRMMHPRYHFPKVYNVILDKTPQIDDLKKMSRGVMLEGKKTIPALYEMMGKTGSKKVRIEIMEGRKRQIKMVFRSMDYRVVALKRLSMGPIELKNMKKGEIREFSMEELFALLKALDLEEY